MSIGPERIGLRNQMMHFGPTEQLIKILWVCLLIKCFMEKLAICLLSQNIKHIGQLNNSIMISNFPVKRGYLILAHQMNGEPKLMKMPNCLNKKLKDGMIKESKSRNLKLVNMFYCITLVLEFLQENFFPNGKGHTLSKKFIALELSRSIMSKVVNGQRIKHYISVTPINVETNIIQTMTPEEHIKETLWNTPES